MHIESTALLQHTEPHLPDLLPDKADDPWAVLDGLANQLWHAPFQLAHGKLLTLGCRAVRKVGQAEPVRVPPGKRIVQGRR